MFIDGSQVYNRLVIVIFLVNWRRRHLMSMCKKNLNKRHSAVTYSHRFSSDMADSHVRAQESKKSVCFRWMRRLHFPHSAAVLWQPSAASYHELQEAAGTTIKNSIALDAKHDYRQTDTQTQTATTHTHGNTQHTLIVIRRLHTHTLTHSRAVMNRCMESMSIHPVETV